MRFVREEQEGTSRRFYVGEHLTTRKFQMLPEAYRLGRRLYRDFPEIGRSGVDNAHGATMCRNNVFIAELNAAGQGSIERVKRCIEEGCRNELKVTAPDEHGKVIVRASLPITHWDIEAIAAMDGVESVRRFQPKHHGRKAIAVTLGVAADADAVLAKIVEFMQ